MRVNSVNKSTNFKSMYIGSSIEKRLADKRCTKFPQSLKKIEDIIKLNRFDKKENVDIILQLEDKNRFYAVISSKKEGVPMHPSYRCYISADDKSIENFSKWVNEWNDDFSPERLSILERIIKKIK